MDQLDDPVTSFARTIDLVKDQCGIRSLLGCTNYMDVRLVYLLDELVNHNKCLNEEQSSLLLERLEAFVNSLDSNGEYFIPNAGTYKLNYDYNQLKIMIHLCKALSKK